MAGENLIQGDISSGVSYTPKSSKEVQETKDPVALSTERLQKITDKLENSSSRASKSTKTKLQKQAKEESAFIMSQLDKRKDKGVKAIAASALSVVSSAFDTLQYAVDTSATAHKKDPYGLEQQRENLQNLKQTFGMGEEAPAVQEAVPDTSIKSKLVQRNLQDANDPNPTPIASGAGSLSLTAERTAPAAIDERVEFDPGEAPVYTPPANTGQSADTPEVPAYTPPSAPYQSAETLEAATSQPTAENGELGGPGSYAYEMGFKAEMDEIDGGLKSDLEEIAKQKGWIAIVQGLGMAASAWYGLQNNVDMTGINFQKQPSFEAEEQAILDKVKFRREQLLNQRKEDIDQRQRTQDIQTQDRRRAEDRTDTQAYRKYQSDLRGYDLQTQSRNRTEDKLETQAYRAYTAKMSKYNAEADAAWKQAQLDLDYAKLGKEKLRLQGKVAEAKATKTGNVKDIIKAEAAARTEAESGMRKIEQLDPKKYPEDVTEERKVAAVRQRFAALKVANRHRIAEIEAVENSLITPKEEGYLWNTDAKVEFDEVEKAISELDKKERLSYSTAGAMYQEKVREETGYTKEAEAVEQASAPKPMDAPIPTEYDTAKETVLQNFLKRNKGKFQTREQAVMFFRKNAPTKGY